MHVYCLLFATALAVCLTGTTARAEPWDEGDVRFFKVANADFDFYIDAHDPAYEQWMLENYAVMKGFSPRFDEELAWFEQGWFYRDAYAIKPDDPEFVDHPEWILRDGAGNMLYIPFACSGGTCTQFAGDFGNPAFVAHWTAEAQQTMSQGYQGIWIDDVNLTWRASDGFGNPVTPIDPRTGELMTLTDWRRYLAEFMEAVRTALPASQIAHNIVWYATDEDNSDPFQLRTIAAADFINLERGVTDLGLTGNGNRFSLTTFLAFIDFVHARGRQVILLDEATTTVQRKYALAGWLAINNGGDLVGSENTSWTTPDSWWHGYNTDLGAAHGPRYVWQTLVRRDFACGLVLMNPPDRANVTVALGDTYTDIDGQPRSSVTLPGDHAAILSANCPVEDQDGDLVADAVDNCTEVANPGQVDTNGDGFGNACDPDLNNDGIVNAGDLGLLRNAFFATGAQDSDFNGDRIVNAADIGILKAFFFASPGPSGLNR